MTNKLTITQIKEYTCLKRIIYLFILLTLTTQNAAGFDIDWSSFGDWFSHGTPHGAWSNESTSFTIYYDSYDGQKNKVRLSARVYVPQSVSLMRLSSQETTLMHPT